ncbi:tyrosyl-tRNA synthetase [Umbelopsis sp. WA50703]
MGLLHFHIQGHQAIALIGGATGSIGDPSGRQSERIPLSPETLQTNVEHITRQIHRFFENGSSYAMKRGWLSANSGQCTPKVLNNAEWLKSMGALDFLGDVGRYARVSQMLARESVKARLNTDHGISFTEFAYQLLQAYDFWYLYHYHSCRIQLGGSDQWGNIVAGIDMIHKKKPNSTSLYVSTTDEESRKLEDRAFGVTIPLLLTSKGEKFGKSAGNAVWLDETMTSLFDFYQFFVKTSDDDVERYLPLFTLMNNEEISAVMNEHKQNPEKRIAQHKLAEEAIELVHGPESVNKAKTATKVLFGGNLEEIGADSIIQAFAHDNSRMRNMEKGKVVEAGLDTVAVLAGATKSKSETQKLIKSGGVYLNNVKISDPRFKIQESDLLNGKLCVLRIGKTSYHMLHLQ